MFVEFVYAFFYKGFKNPGLSIAAISVIVNLLALPLYNIAESLQKKERDMRVRLQPGIDRIKMAFKGDERYMMLSAFYRQNNYHPAYALRSSISLIIQVPFFIAAYHFLSHLEQLQGQSFSFIPDLGSPDGLLAIGEMSINLLPVLMTLINIIAGAVYTKGFPLRDKFQLYGMAGLFLVLLYTSPAGLVLYWTLNNVFSLIKNIFYKLKHPQKILYIIITIGTLIVATAIWIAEPGLSQSERIILVGGCFFMAVLPLFLRAVNMVFDQFLKTFADNGKQRNLVFILSGLLLFLINGVMVPANLIASSTIDFSFVGTVENPLMYVANTATVFFGLWVVWGGFIYAMAKKRMKAIVSFLYYCLSVTSILNLFVFGGEYGIVSKLLQFENPSLLNTDTFLLIAPMVAILLVIVIGLILLKWRKGSYISTILIILTLTAGTSSLVSCTTIQSEFSDYKKSMIAKDTFFNEATEIEPVFHFSCEGKNVLFIFLDRALNFYFPYIHDQFPEMEDQFKGFVYYPNTVSFGRNTLLGAPAMMGGYEYTPEAINARSAEKLVDKHNESLLVLPKLFLENGYSVTVTDPPLSNYKGKGDFTPFEKYTDIEVLQHIGKFSLNYKNEFSDVLSWSKEYESTLIMKRLPVFSILRTTLPVVRRPLYGWGGYFLMSGNPQSTEDFIDSYAQLYYLRELTDFKAEGNTYTFISNDTTHQPIFLQAPSYEPQTVVTNQSTPLDDNPGMSEVDIRNYHANAAALRRLGIWFEQLQEAGVYDNTRIIIVSDHGSNLYSPYFEDFSQNKFDYPWYSPLMLFKDFESDGRYLIDDSFMTNADAPIFAIHNLEIPPINPFTKKNMVESVDKQNVKVFEGPFNPRDNSVNLFNLILSQSFSIHDSIFEESNWTRLTEQ
jgi:YidC/Oxa1 family membrane protein insertase